MPSWLIPVLKSVLPYVGTIVSAAAPVFTKKNADAANQAMLQQQQITELQAAASGNGTGKWGKSCISFRNSFHLSRRNRGQIQMIFV